MFVCVRLKMGAHVRMSGDALLIVSAVVVVVVLVVVGHHAYHHSCGNLFWDVCHNVVHHDKGILHGGHLYDICFL